MLNPQYQEDLHRYKISTQKNMKNLLQALHAYALHHDHHHHRHRDHDHDHDLQFQIRIVQ